MDDKMFNQAMCYQGFEKQDPNDREVKYDHKQSAN